MAKDRKVATTTARAKLVVKKLLTILTRNRTKCTEQSGSEQVDNNEEVIVLARKGKKVTITTVFAKLVDKKLLTALSVKKIWI